MITAADTLPLRSTVLRNGAPIHTCVLENDHLSDTFHMGYYTTNGQLVSILTCQAEPLKGEKTPGYRLRGMATHPQYAGKGVGSTLLKKAMCYLKDNLQADHLWCNARQVAYGFYEKLGFQFCSEEFDIPEIGPHKVMLLQFRLQSDQASNL